MFTIFEIRKENIHYILAPQGNFSKNMSPGGKIAVYLTKIPHYLRNIFCKTAEKSASAGRLKFPADRPARRPAGRLIFPASRQAGRPVHNSTQCWEISGKVVG